MKNKELLTELFNNPELIKEMKALLEPKEVVKEFIPPTGHNDCLDYVHIPEDPKPVCCNHYIGDPHDAGYRGPRW